MGLGHIQFAVALLEHVGGVEAVGACHQELLEDGGVGREGGLRLWQGAEEECDGAGDSFGRV